jgi:hypothetical protein
MPITRNVHRSLSASRWWNLLAWRKSSRAILYPCSRVSQLQFSALRADDLLVSVVQDVYEEHLVSCCHWCTYWPTQQYPEALCLKSIQVFLRVP